MLVYQPFAVGLDGGAGQGDRRGFGVVCLEAGDDGDSREVALGRHGHGESHARPVKVARKLLTQPLDAVGFTADGFRHFSQFRRNESCAAAGVDQKHIPVGQSADLQAGCHL